jgi:predicted dehydrogenase
MLRIGILGTGRIARVFAAEVQSSLKLELAVASRDARQARSFADDFGIARAHQGYEALLADNEIDAVYNALPSSLHAPWSIRAAEAGKHVLCEKPLAASAAEVRAMFVAAERNGVRIVEAYPYRAQPHTLALRRLIAEGAIGTVRMIEASFSFPMPQAGDFRFDPSLGGGALLDAGSYPVSFVRMIAGSAPSRVSATARFGSSGIDHMVAASLDHADGPVAQISCAFGTAPHRRAVIVGDTGIVETSYPNRPSPAFPSALLVRRGSGWDIEPERIQIEAVPPFRAQAESFADMIARGDAQWTGATPSESVDIAITLDAIAESARTGRAVSLPASFNRR